MRTLTKRISVEFSPVKASRRKYREKIYEYIDAVRESEPCLGCGNNDKWVKEFHHIDPEEKLFNVSNSWKNYSLPRVAAEIEKCAILCANCHSRVTYGVDTIEVVDSKPVYRRGEI